jgi:hypothetical protein
MNEVAASAPAKSNEIRLPRDVYMCVRSGNLNTATNKNKRASIATDRSIMYTPRFSPIDG